MMRMTGIEMKGTGRYKVFSYLSIISNRSRDMSCNQKPRIDCCLGGRKGGITHACIVSESLKTFQLSPYLTTIFCCTGRSTSGSLSEKELYNSSCVSPFLLIAECWGLCVDRARICKRLRRPGIDSEDSSPPVYVSWRSGMKNRVVVSPRQAGNRFLGSLKGQQREMVFLA